MRFLFLRFLRSKPALLKALLAALALSAGLAASRLHRTDPIMIGFVGSLSGPAAQAGRSCSDGAVMAIEDCNSTGGIGGTAVRLELRDDAGSAAVAADVIRSLSEQRAWALVGPTNSAVAAAAAAAAGRESLLMLSPNLSTDAARSNSEYIVSMRLAAPVAAEYIARHLRFRRGMLRTLIVIDSASGEYPPGIESAVAQIVATSGGNVVQTIHLAAPAGRDYPQMAQVVVGSGADSVLFFAGGTEIAMLLQHLRSVGCDLPAIAYEPASIPELLAYGGSGTDGLTLISCVAPHILGERFRAFSDRFRKRFGREPDLPAICAYDATRLALLSISDADGREDVRRAMLSRQLDGLQGRISIGSSGSPKRELRLFRIQQGAIVPFD